MSKKGGQWERDVCKFLSKWIQGTEKPYIFWRGRGSGGMFTSNNFVGETFAGDIYNIREEGKFLTNKFVIECKNGYAGISFDNHLKKLKSDDIEKFWFKVCEESIKTHKKPMLIYKKKGYKIPWIFISLDFFKKINKYINAMRYVNLKWIDNECYVFDFYEFFENITPDIIKKIK